MLPQEASGARTRVRERKRIGMQIRSMRLEYLRLGGADERISRYMPSPMIKIATDPRIRDVDASIETPFNSR